MNWKALIAGLVLGLAPALLCPAPACAAEGKDRAKKSDPAAEAKEAAQEDADEIADRIAGIKGKRQRRFHGTFLLPSDPSQQTSPDVVGTLVTDESDPKPNQTYLVKVEDGSKEIIETLKRFDTKKVWADGKLRNQAKYLIIRAVSEPGPTPRAPERRSAGGI